MHSAVDWRTHSCSWLDKEIDAQVNSSALLGGICAVGKERRRVEQPRFIVLSNADDGASALHLGENLPGKRLASGRARVRAKKSAPDTQVQDDVWGVAQISGKDRLSAATGVAEPVGYIFRIRHGCTAAGITEIVVGKSRMDLGPALECFPSRRFADGDIGIIRFETLANRGVGDADRETHAD